MWLNEFFARGKAHSPKVATIWASGQARRHALDFRGWFELSDEFGRTLFEEINYLQEGRNADRLRYLMRNRPRIRVPRVYWKYTGRRVLTLEYIGGTKISQVEDLAEQGFDLKELGNLLVNCYLEQFVLTGFFHADPHAGNLAVDLDGNLIIYDFGMMGEIKEEQRRSLLMCVMSVVRRDPEQVTKYLMELGIVSGQASLETVSRTIGPFIDYYAGKDILDLDFQHLEQDIDQVIAERSFRLPANLAYLLRAGSSLEGIARTLKPDFSFVAAVQPVMTRWALQQGIETLARNGRLFEFAELAISELSRAIGNSNHLPLSGEVKRSGASESSRAAPPGKRAEPSTKEIVPAHEALNGAAACQPSLANCPDCLACKAQIRALHKRLKITLLLGIVYLCLSTATLVFLSMVALGDYRQLSLYFLIGNGILGAIIIWKFTNLLKLNPHSAEVEKTKGNGEQEC